MELEVTVEEAQNLKNVGGTGLLKRKKDLSDPYAVIEFDGQKYAVLGFWSLTRLDSRQKLSITT